MLLTITSQKKTRCRVEYDKMYNLDHELHRREEEEHRERRRHWDLPEIHATVLQKDREPSRRELANDPLDSVGTTGTFW